MRPVRYAFHLRDRRLAGGFAQVECVVCACPPPPGYIARRRNPGLLFFFFLSLFLSLSLTTSLLLFWMRCVALRIRPPSAPALPLPSMQRRRRLGVDTASALAISEIQFNSIQFNSIQFNSIPTPPTHPLSPPPPPLFPHLDLPLPTRRQSFLSLQLSERESPPPSSSPRIHARGSRGTAGWAATLEDSARPAVDHCHPSGPDTYLATPPPRASERVSI